MIAFFNLSPIHLLILLMVGLAVIGIPILVVMLVLKQSPGSERTPTEPGPAELRAEIERLRAEVERLKKGQS